MAQNIIPGYHRTITHSSESHSLIIAAKSNYLLQKIQRQFTAQNIMHCYYDIIGQSLTVRTVTHF